MHAIATFVYGVMAAILAGLVRLGALDFRVLKW